MLFKWGIICNTFSFVWKWFWTVKQSPRGLKFLCNWLERTTFRDTYFVYVLECFLINTWKVGDLVLFDFIIYGNWWLLAASWQKGIMAKQIEKARLRLIMSSCHGQDDSLWQKFLLGIWKKHTEGEQQQQYCVEITKRDDQDSVSVSRYRFKFILSPVHLDVDKEIPFVSLTYVTYGLACQFRFLKYFELTRVL